MNLQPKRENYSFGLKTGRGGGADAHDARALSSCKGQQA